ncbi:HNH endonuclease family protein [Vibrio fluvialis]|uniref:HNH endonuclease family protein n=1 Tax=Vibrio fluvialis TaxID=676 RepID=UPI0028F6EA28|nr:HNH endonuclease family protein [Vibrio fluvialis]
MAATRDWIKITKPGEEDIRKDEYLVHLEANLTILKQQVDKLAEQSDFDIHGFAGYIFKQVQWVNNIVPASMDLNRLFSSLNTGGIQLEPVDLLKAKLFKHITTDKAIYSSIWQACEHTDNYFERNLRQIFKNADWQTLEYTDLANYQAELFPLVSSSNSVQRVGKSIAEIASGSLDFDVEPEQSESQSDDFDDETVYCRSIISFELLLIHTLRIFCTQKSWDDLTPRIRASNLMSCFEGLLQHDERTIKSFIELLWQVRYQFDTWVVKWVEHDDREDAQLRLTSISKNKAYINRKAKELGLLAQLQSVRNFTGDRSAQYWLTAFLCRLVADPKANDEDVVTLLESIDNKMSLTSETQKEASFKLASDISPQAIPWEEQASYLKSSLGTRFEHYWFQKLEYLLWKNGDKTNDDKLKRYRITSKNSVEHVHPQNEEYHHELEKSLLNAFGNLVLLSPGENSSYSNQTVAKKKADFDSKPRYDALKLKDIFETYTQSNGQWSAIEIDKHQQKMLKLLEKHYMEGVVNGQ